MVWRLMWQVTMWFTPPRPLNDIKPSLPRWRLTDGAINKKPRG
jgi:hypothetical protein